MIIAPARDAPQSYEIRAPRLSDAPAIHALIARCPPLDTNSLYCSLLQCAHHAQTCALAEQTSGDPIGFVSSYRLPQDPENLFVWQVAIDERARGCGLARKLIRDILGRPACRGVHSLRTTITADNGPSWAMFRRLAKSLNATSKRRELFDSERHFAGEHSSEHELIIGPFTFLPASRKESNE